MGMDFFTPDTYLRHRKRSFRGGCKHVLCIRLTCVYPPPTANVKKCAVVVCNKDEVNSVTARWKWGEDELPVVDQCRYLGVEISNVLLLRCTHSAINRKG